MVLGKNSVFGQKKRNQILLDNLKKKKKKKTFSYDHCKF